MQKHPFLSLSSNLSAFVRLKNLFIVTVALATRSVTTPLHILLAFITYFKVQYPGSQIVKKSKQGNNFHFMSLPRNPRYTALLTVSVSNNIYNQDKGKEKRKSISISNIEIFCTRFEW